MHMTSFINDIQTKKSEVNKLDLLQILFKDSAVQRLLVNKMDDEQIEEFMSIKIIP